LHVVLAESRVSKRNKRVLAQRTVPRVRIRGKLMEIVFI
jgi:hypothetical protein